MNHPEDWEGCYRASSNIWDLVCAMYCPGDAQARLVAPVSTTAEMIAFELGIEVPE